MDSWSFLTNHGRVLLRIAQDPAAQPRAIAAPWVSPSAARTASFTYLTAVGYVLKQKDGRCNRYRIQAHLPLPEPGSREPAMGDVLAVLMSDRVREG